MGNVLSISGITKKYPKIYAVKDLSLKVDKGNVFGILGPNGSGKTTTLGVILGVINATSGTYSWFGQPDNVNNRKKMGALLETPNFYDGLSGMNNLRIVAKIKNVPEEDIQRVSKMVELDGRMSDKFKTYSLGMKQRLAIASTLLGNPEVIILDEPTNGLDPKGIIDIRELIINIANQGVTVLLASHALDEVEKVCSHVVVIREGIKLYSGRVDEMTASKGLFELKTANDKIKLLTLLEQHHSIGAVKEEGEFIIAYLTEEMEATEINTFLFKNGIAVSHLVKRKPSLEQQFLDLTNIK